MTLSEAFRSENAEEALRLMMKGLGQRAFFCRVLGPTDKPPYENILPTTWRSLEDKHFVKPFISAGPINRYELTGSGWVKGLELTGALSAAKEHAGKLRAAIRRHLGDRTKAKIVLSNSLAEEAGMTLDFVHNLLDSDFIQVVFGKVGVKTKHCINGVYLIEIPINFGHDLS